MGSVHHYCSGKRPWIWDRYFMGMTDQCLTAVKETNDILKELEKGQRTQQWIWFIPLHKTEFAIAWRLCEGFWLPVSKRMCKNWKKKMQRKAMWIIKSMNCT